MWTNWWWQFFKFNVNVHLQTNLAHINMNPNKKFQKKMQMETKNYYYETLLLTIEIV